MTTDELQIQITADTGNASQNINETANALNKLDNSAKTADDGMSQLVKAMSDAALNMVSVSQNIAQSAAGMSDYRTSFDNLSATLTNFSARLESVNALTAGTSFDAAAASVQALSAASESSAAALSGIVTATDGFNERMDALSDTTHGTTTGMVDLQKEIVSAVAEIRGFADNLGTAGQDAAATSQKIRDLSEDVEKLVKSSQAGGAAAVNLAAGFGKLKGIIATLGVGKFIKDSNDAYNVQMQNELKLTAHMKHRMNATDDEIQSIKDLASAQQKIGVIGDEIQLAGAQQLTTYAKQSNTLKTLLPAMNNLIAQNAGYDATAGDATSAADMLGRALNGQYTSLKRMGVTFTEAQENILKYGNEEQKAAALADAINSKVGNMNELLSQTPTGQLKQLQNDFGDLQEQLGATFQPLISAVLPLVRGALETLVPPVMNFSRGVVTIGSAIASVDSPATRGIALAAAGIAVMNKLKLAIGGTSAGLLLLGVVLTGIIGGMQEQQDDIGATVKSAMDSAENATEKASEAVSDYNKQLNNTEKTINRLAGFDTITKLTGGSSSGGALVNALLGDNGIGDIQAATLEVGDLQAALDNVKAPDFSNGTIGIRQFADIATSNLEMIGRNGEFFARNLAYVFTHLGDDGAIYGPLNSMTNKIEDILNAVGLDGTGFVNFWKDVGSDIYDAMAGNDSDIYRALSDIDYAITKMNLRWKIGAIDAANVFGKSMYALTHAEEIAKSGQSDAYIEDLFNSLPDGLIVKDVAKAIYTNSGLKDSLQNQITADEYSLREYQILLQQKLREGLSSQDAFDYATTAYLSSDRAQKWLDTFVSPSDRSWFNSPALTENMRLQMIQSGEISSSQSYKDVPIQPTSIPSYVTDKGYVTNVQVYINDEERDASYVKITGGK